MRDLCARFGIGIPTGKPSRITGGYHHRVWRLDTDRGAFAVKQLSADTDLDDPHTRYHYNVSEAIAETFAGYGIPAIFALKYGGGYLQVMDDSGYLVHPWRNAAALKLNQISERHALRVAGLLARMHSADIVFLGVAEQAFDIHSEEKITMLVDFACDYHVHLSDELRKELPTFLGIIDAQRSAIPVLEGHLVISHGDLDQKNVLWDAMGRPALIDWESARRLNPTYEILLEALNWSGIGSQFDPGLFEKIITAYQEGGGVIEYDAVAASIQCILGDWVNWLMYNVGRSFDQENANLRTIGAAQVEFALATVSRLKRLQKDLNYIIHEARH